jgi:hypothetical protein
MSDRDVRAAEAKSRRLRGLEALREPLGKWSGWRLAMICDGCPGMREIQVQDLAEERGNAVTLGVIVDRLVCGKCRTKPSYVGLHHHVARVPLRGSRPGE